MRQLLSFLDYRPLRQLLTVIFVSLAAFSIASPFHPFWVACKVSNIVYVSLGFLLLGLFFLFINQTRLLFVCLGCSAAISFFLNESKDPQVRQFPTSPPVEEVMPK